MIEDNTNNEVHFFSPSEFYRQRRPEFFSDSENITNINLPREVLAYEIEKISTNQKQDLFETLCRRLAERLICPNLIPQVGPTGGGDGKTDTETYPVSEVISERWYIPQDGWKNDEKWAFAFSAKKDWEAKIKSDIDKIVNTNRGYTKIFFISNQTIPSKKKKDVQDALIEKYRIEVIILDAVWIIENIYEKNLIELVADTLNMSDAYRIQEKRLGKNDSERLNELEEIEKRINDTNYYLPGDIQLLHDAIRTIILSRMIEKPREEIEAKFIRAERLCNKYNEKSLLPKIIYQKAWTYINYYDDYSGFINEVIKLKKLINENSTNIEIEWLFNILNLYRPVHDAEMDNVPDRDLIYNDFEKYVINILFSRSQNQDMPCSALIAKTYLSFIELIRLRTFQEDPSIPLRNLSAILLESKKYIEYPFEEFYIMITDMGIMFTDNIEYDTLIDNLADILSSRKSEINSGIVFFNHGIQKFNANKFKESIIYLGKSIFKLAKKETSDKMILSLIALSESYKELALPWASYNCLITAASIEVKKWYEEKIVTERFLSIIKSILSTEILLGRLPNIFFWYGLFSFLYKEYGEKDENIPDDILIDGCLAVRLLHTDQNENNLIYLPNILANIGLQISSDAVLYLLGYVDEIIEHYKNSGINNSIELETFFQKAYSQPLADQTFFQTDFQNSDTLVLKSIIIGCNIIFEFNKDMNLVFLVEMILALIESIFATSVGKILPTMEKIFINVIEDNYIDYFSLSKDNKTNKIILKVNYNNIITGDHELMFKSFLEFFSFILVNCFNTENINEYLYNIFHNERLNERLSFIYNHTQFSTSIMGTKPKIFFNYWKKDVHVYKNKRLTPIIFKQNIDEIPKDSYSGKKTMEDTPHNKFEIHSIIDNNLWGKAIWRATGILVSPETLGLVLAFEDFDMGKKIFEDWKKIIGNIDKDEIIDITIIKGVNIHNPCWYRVVVTMNQEKVISDKRKFYFLYSRINEMNPDNSKNLNMFEQTFKERKKYIIFPSSTKSLLPEHLKYGIQKTKITIKNAWQIGIGDQNQVAIHDDDEPILPEGIDEIPILALLKQRKNRCSK